jgi:hypothetical protein
MSSSNTDFLLINIETLYKLAGKNILTELSSHLEISQANKFKWPEKHFYVSIDLETDDDTNGIKYFAREDSTEPFLTMGYSDTGFFVTVAMLKAVANMIKNNY